ncbi:unnamed protein product [Prunus armeniaca]
MRMISAQVKAEMLGFTMLTTKKVEVVLMFINQGGVETTTFVAIHFMQTKASVLGLSKLATSTTRSRAIKLSDVRGIRMRESFLFSFAQINNKSKYTQITDEYMLGADPSEYM